MEGGPLSSATKGGGGNTVGRDGHRCEPHHRGTTCALHMNSSVGGKHSHRHFFHTSNYNSFQSSNLDTSPPGPRVELPQFDGANPKLWQRRCVECFQRWQSPAHLWVSYASSLFIGDAANWLKSYLQQTSKPIWADFAAAVMTRFSRNQHQILLRRLFHISQTTTVEDYVRCFAQLVDHIASYETRPDPVHYTTRFLDGLKRSVRVLVTVQQPPDLDTAYSFALLYEGLGHGITPLNCASAAAASSRRPQALPPPHPPPPPPAKWISRTVEEKRVAE